VKGVKILDPDPATVKRDKKYIKILKKLAKLSRNNKKES